MKRLDNPRKHFFKENINLFAGGGNVFSRNRPVETEHMPPVIDNIINEYMKPATFDEIKHIYRRDNLEMELGALKNKRNKTQEDRDAIKYIKRMLKVVR